MRQLGRMIREFFRPEPKYWVSFPEFADSTAEKKIIIRTFKRFMERKIKIKSKQDVQNY